MWILENIMIPKTQIYYSSKIKSELPYILVQASSSYSVLPHNYLTSISRSLHQPLTFVFTYLFFAGFPRKSSIGVAEDGRKLYTLQKPPQQRVHWSQEKGFSSNYLLWFSLSNKLKFFFSFKNNLFNLV